MFEDSDWGRLVAFTTVNEVAGAARRRTPHLLELSRFGLCPKPRLVIGLAMPFN